MIDRLFRTLQSKFSAILALIDIIAALMFGIPLFGAVFIACVTYIASMLMFLFFREDRKETSQ